MCEICNEDHGVGIMEGWGEKAMNKIYFFVKSITFMTKLIMRIWIFKES